MPHSIANHHKKSHLDTAEINMEHLQINNNNDSGVGGIFNNVEHLSRGEGTVNSNNPNSDGNGAPHEKESTEQTIQYYNIENLAGQSLRDINGGADTDNNSMNGVGGSSTSGLHGKSNFAPPPTPRPNNPPTPSPEAVYIPSLRDAHKSSNNGDPSHGHTAVHSKYSQEQNAQNPEDKPKGWIAPEPEPEGEEEEGEDETTQIERVQGANPTYDTTHNNSNGGNGECKSNTNNGQFFNGQTTRNGGVVLRYQYELVQHVGEGSLAVGPPQMEVGEALEYNVLPRLEGSVSDLLIPVFFEECRDNEVRELRGGERRGLGAVEDGWGDLLLSQGNSQGLRQHRRLNKVVGIDAKPDDFALTQAECELHSPSPYEITKCHKVEGALTLYFPPNYSLSTILAAAKLSALQAIQQGMNDGSLATSHEDISKLYFLESSFSLHHDILDNGSDYGDGDEPAVGVLDDGGTNTGKIVGIVLGILLPLLICCCGFGFFFWKKRQQEQQREDEVEDEDEDGDSSSDSSESTTNYKRRAQRDSRHDEQQRQLRSGNTSSRHRHGGGSDGESEYDGETDAMHTEDEESQMYTKDEESQYDTGATTTSASASEYDTGATTTSASECFDEDDASSQSSISIGAPPSRPAAAQYVEYTSDSDNEGTSEEEGGTHVSSSTSASSSSSSSSSSSEEQDHFPMPNPLEPIFEEVERERQKKKKAKKRQARMRRRYERMQKKADKNKRDVNSNIVMTGSHDDNMSVMTGATGATGLHSLASQRTARVRNNNVGDGDDNRSVMTGATGMTQRVSNTNPYVREELD